MKLKPLLEKYPYVFDNLGNLMSGRKYPNHEDKNKGAWHGECNRTACDQKDAQFYNLGTDGFYCARDAWGINEFPQREGQVLCVKQNLDIPDEQTLIPKDDELLHVACHRVPDVTDPKLQALVPKMFELMEAKRGVGLAAPQIGLTMRLFIMSYGGRKYTCVNPRILEVSEEVSVDFEGCLSYPGEQHEMVTRPSEIKVEYETLTGVKKKHRLKGMLARVFQHEFDHINGIVYLERAINVDAESRRVLSNLG